MASPLYDKGPCTYHVLPAITLPQKESYPQYQFISRSVEHRSRRRPFPAQDYVPESGLFIGRDVKNLPTAKNHKPKRPNSGAADGLTVWHAEKQYEQQLASFQQQKRRKKLDRPHMLLSRKELAILWWAAKTWVKSKLPSRQKRIQQRLDSFVGRPGPRKKTDSHFLVAGPHDR